MSDLREQLLAIRSANGGVLTPEAVVRAARPARHPLHARFDWNDREAGEKWRRTQAAELIRSVQVVYRQATAEEDARRVRAFLHVDRPDGRDYMPIEEVAADSVVSRIVLADAERQAAEWFRRFGHLQEALEMMRELLAA